MSDLHSYSAGTSESSSSNGWRPIIQNTDSSARDEGFAVERPHYSPPENPGEESQTLVLRTAPRSINPSVGVFKTTAKPGLAEELLVGLWSARKNRAGLHIGVHPAKYMKYLDFRRQSTLYLSMVVSIIAISRRMRTYGETCHLRNTAFPFMIFRIPN